MTEPPRARVTIEVGTPDISNVRCGALWLTSRGYYTLVMTPVTDLIYNIACWELDQDFAQAQASMINAYVLAVDGEFIASPLPALVEMIESAVADTG